MGFRFNLNRRVPGSSFAVVVLAAILIIASTRLRAETGATGSFGGANVTVPFTDVPATNISCSIAAAYFSGLTNGTTATTYSPATAVSREQMAAFITRTLYQSLRRGSRRAALKQFGSPRNSISLPSTVVGDGPIGVECDGADLWVVNDGSDTISRVRASDGRLLGTWTGAKFEAEAKQFDDCASVYHDIRCPACGTTAIDTSRVNQSYREHGQS
jgi:S-layer homology domain